MPVCPRSLWGDPIRPGGIMIFMSLHVENDPSRNRTHGVTQILDAVRFDEPGAQDRLFELVFGELYHLARRQLAHERGPVTLQPTALVNEAYLRLFGGASGAAEGDGSTFENRRHFFGAAAQAMHRICVDYARRRRAAKRGGAHRLDTGAAGDGEFSSPTSSPARKGPDEPAVFDRDPVQVLAVDEALARLAKEDAELVEIVRLRYFMDLSLDDTAKALGISRRTVASRWRLAKAWLFEALKDFKEPSGAE